MKHLDLFSGIGGFALAADCAGYDTIAFCERDSFCQKILKKHWPDVAIYDDVHNLNGWQFKHVDLLTAGFPCQSFSTLGTKKGVNDERYLFPQALRIIKESNPVWIILENVLATWKSIGNEITTSLMAAGYFSKPLFISASDVGAPHQRKRMWIIANTDSKSVETNSQAITVEIERDARLGFTRQIGKRFSLPDWKASSPRVSRMVDGFPNRMDRTRCLGNAIVPQIAFKIMTALGEKSATADKREAE